jgi:hypothetical protein
MFSISRMNLIVIINRIVSICLVSIFLQACSGITVSQDYEKGYDFSALKTFAWKPNVDNEYGLKDNDLMDKRIRTAIESGLKTKAFTQIDDGTPDIYVSYHITVEQKISSSNVSGGIAFGRSSFGHVGGVGISTGTDIRTYDQGTMLIDFTDTKSKKLIWRGMSTQVVSEHSDPDTSTAMINETVDKILQQFPPGK